MAKKKKEATNEQTERVEKYAGWLKEGKAHQKKNAEKWPVWLGYLENKSSVKPIGDYEYRVFINLAYNNWQTLRPALYFQDPKFRAKIRPGAGANLPFGGELTARLAENILAFYVKELNLKRELKLALIETLVLGTSAIKQGYHGSTKKIEKKRANLKLITGMKDAMSFQADDMAKAVKELEVTDLQALTLSDSPDEETWWAKWVSIKDLFLPYGYGNWASDCPWLIHRLYKRKDAAWRDYPLIEEMDIDPTYNSGMVPRGKPDCYEICEVWNWDERRVDYLVPDKSRNQIVKGIDEWPRGLEKYPIEFLKFGETPDKFYALPDTPFYEDLMEMITEAVSTNADYMRRAKTQYWAMEDLEQNTKTQMERPVDGRVINGMSKPPPTLLPIIQAPPSNEFLINRLLGFHDQLSGITEYRRGGASRRRTATQVSAESEGMDLKLEEKGDILDDFLSAIGNTGFQLIQKNMSSPLMVELAPEEMKQFNLKNPFFKISQEDINADLQISVVAGSSMMKEDATQSKSYQDAFQLSMNIPFVDKRKVYIATMTKALNLPKEEVESWLLPEQDPDAVGLAKAENMMAVQGMPLSPPGPQETHTIHLEIHQGLLTQLNPQIVQENLMRVQQQAQAYSGGGQIPQGPVPNDLNAQIAEAQKRVQTAPKAAQVLQQHIQQHEQFMQGGKPMDYNLLQARPKQPGGGGPPAAGGSTPAEQAGQAGGVR